MISFNIQKMPVRSFSPATKTATPASVSSQSVLRQNNTLPSYPRGLSFGCESRFGWVPTDKYEPGMAHVEYRGSGDLEEFVVGDFVDAKKVDLNVKEEIKTGTDFEGANVFADKGAEFGDKSIIQKLTTYGDLKAHNSVEIASAEVSGNTIADDMVSITELHNVNNLTAGVGFQADRIWNGGNIELGDGSNTRCVYAGGDVKLGRIDELQEIHFVRNPIKKDLDEKDLDEKKPEEKEPDEKKPDYRVLEFDSKNFPESVRIYLGKIKKLDIFIKGLKDKDDVTEFVDKKLDFYYEYESPDSTEKFAAPDLIKARRLTESECQHVKVYGVSK